MVRPGALALVEIALVQEDVDRAEQLWRAYELDEDPLTARAAVATRQVRARLMAARGEDALAELYACGEHERAWGIRNPTHSTWRSDAVRLGATELVEPDLERARAFGDPRALGIALRAAGRTQEAIDVLRESPARLELALALHDHGAALRRRGHRVAAREPLAEAIGFATALHATTLAAKAHDELVGAGARPRRDPIASRTHLTASETRVARMAADGMTNRAIAQALFLTEKTIEVHLTSTYRKLDIRSRSQLPRALGETLG
jgi:DNA-binding CsgD family transcriptional regulator